MQIWNSESGELFKTISNEHGGMILGILVVSDDKFLSYSLDGNVKLFNLDNFDCIHTFDHSSSDLIELISNEKLAISYYDQISIIDLNTDECLKTLECQANCMKSISNEILATGSKNDINIWNIDSGMCSKTLIGHDANVRSIIKLSNEQLASCAADKKIKIWDIKSGECLKTIENDTNVFCLTKISDTKIIAYLEDKTLKVLNIETGNCLQTINDIRQFDISIY